MATKQAKPESFVEVLRAVEAATGWNHRTFAARLGVSGRTFTRYYHGQAKPPAVRRLDVVHRLAEVPLLILIRLAVSLGVSEAAARAAHKAPQDSASAVPHIQAALLRGLDVASVTAAQARSVLEPVLQTMVDRDVDAATALAALRGR